jgi:hypothetical protein
MKKLTLFIALVVLATIGFGQNNDLPKREAYQLKLAVDGENFYQEDVKPTDYVYPDNSIQLYPGEKVYLEVELKNGAIKSLKSVKQNLYPEKTLEISFTQSTEGKIHAQMILKVVNPFDKKLDYTANIYLMMQKKWISTSIIPVLPKLSSYETWPDLIVTIALSGWELK